MVLQSMRNNEILLIFSVTYFNTMTTYISFTLSYRLKIHITFTLPCELSQEQVSVLWKSQAWQWTIPFPQTWQSINSTNWPGPPCLYTLHNDIFIKSILYFWRQLTCTHTFLLKVMFTAECCIGIISVWTILYGCCSCQNILHFFHDQWCTYVFQFLHVTCWMLYPYIVTF
jgi:hypothetical protein